MITKQPSCCGEVVKNSANGQDFWYCRGCKNEIPEALSFEETLVNETFDPATFYDFKDHILYDCMQICMICGISKEEFIRQDRPECHKSFDIVGLKKWLPEVPLIRTKFDTFDFSAIKTYDEFEELLKLREWY